MVNAPSARMKPSLTSAEVAPSRSVPLDRWSEALEHRPGDIKAIIDFSQF
jgi:hypothetical protein